MKDIKLYNVIFPIWFMLFFPPIIFVTLFGNFVIDSIVLILCFSIYHVERFGLSKKPFYKKTIWKVWGYGFLGDFIGAILLFFSGAFSDFLRLPYELYHGINYDPFSHPVAVFIILVAIAISSIFIFLFNYFITFKKIIENKAVRLKIALTFAIVTAPWTFVLPTKWFY